ncbi:MAG: serine protease [Methylophilaceae bacterium]
MKKILLFILLTLPASTYAYDSNPYAAESAIYKVEIKNGNKVHLGTGVLIGKNKILTNCHVVNHKGYFSVVHKKSGQRFNTKSYYNLGRLDACILQGNFPKGNPVKMNTSFTTGENVWTFGYPNNLYASSRGQVNGLVKTDKGMVIESSVYCKPGASGGPLLNVKGELIGLNFGVPTGHHKGRKCLSIPISTIIKRMK